MRAQDIATASLDSPCQLKVVGQSLPNRPCGYPVQSGDAIQITTGAPLPSGADAVVMQEVVERDANTVGIRAPIAPWTNVSRAGEDIEKGEVLFERGRALRPQDQGVLTSVGITDVNVIRRPRVSIFVTGNELLPSGSQPVGYQIVDSSSMMLQSLIDRDGGVSDAPRYLPDELSVIEQAMQSTTADLVIFTGGTSVGVEDFAPRARSDVGELLVHGIHVRPARPVGFGVIGNRPVFLLPGNPLSCLCAYDLVVRLALRKMGMQSLKMPYRQVELPLAQPLNSEVGRIDYARVAIRDSMVVPLKRGRGSGASVLSASSRADGFVLVPESQPMLPAQTLVSVNLYDM